MGDCVVCQRISPKVVFQFLHQVLDGEVNKQNIHNIGMEMMKHINYADRKNRIFFCGYEQKTILASLLYLIGLKSENWFTQRFISGRLSWAPSEATIRRLYSRWLKYFPELFRDIKPRPQNKLISFDSKCSTESKK